MLLGRLLLTAATIMPLLADSPPAVSKDQRVYSADRRYYALSENATKRTRVYRASETRPLWEVPGHYPILFVADGGTHLVAGQHEGNLLPTSARPDTILLRFFTEGNAVRTVTVGEVFPDPKQLPRTSSHLFWGNYFGFAPRGRFVIETYDGRRISYDLATGLPDRAGR